MDIPIVTAADLYREMKRRGLHLRAKNGRDNALLVELVTKLRCPDERLQAFLDTSGLSAEEFLRIFLEVAQPFARMFSEIWDFLSVNCAPKALETITVRFGFPECPEACTVNFEQFRRYVETGRKIIAPITVQLWPFEAMHKLFDIGQTLVPKGEIPFWEAYKEHGRYCPGKPYTLPVPRSTSHPFDKVLKDIAELFQQIIDEYRAESERQKPTQHLPELQEEFSDREIHRSVERAAFLLTDLLPKWFYILSRSESISTDRKYEALAHYQREVAPILESSSAEAQVQVLEALDILDLPFWRHRWHTYEIWSTVLTLRALEEYRPAVRIRNGQIPIDGYSDAIVADIRADGYLNPCVALQVQTRFQKYGRKAIKPDLRICFSDELVAENTAAIVEFKQHRKPQKKSLEEIARSYCEGSPNTGGVIIVNYDTTNVAVSFPVNCFLIEGVHPCNRDSIESFEGSLKSILRAANLRPAFTNTLVLLDVSLSMGHSYHDKDVQRALRSLVRMTWIKVLRFNNGLVAPGDLDESSCAAIRTSGGTELGRAITDVQELLGLPTKMLIVTDGGHDHPTEMLRRIPQVRECLPQELKDHLLWLQESGS